MFLIVVSISCFIILASHHHNSLTHKISFLSFNSYTSGLY